MTRKRPNRDPREAPGTAAGPVQPAAPGAGEKPVEKEPVEKEKEDGKISLFWRVFGGTLLSISAMVAVTVYQQFTGQLNGLRSELNFLNTDLRKDLGRVSENYGELVKKDEMSSRLRSVWDSMKDLRDDRANLTALKERCGVLLELFKAGEEERRQLTAELHKLRRQRAADEEREVLAREVRRIRERIALLEGRQGKEAVKAVSHTSEEP